MPRTKRAISGAGPRLKDEIGRIYDRGYEAFRSQLGHVKGSSKASFWSYLEGETEPPAAFLREAARVLGLTESWLLTGVGPKTTAEQIASHGQDRGPARDHLRDSLRALFPRYAEEDRFGGDLVWWCWVRIAEKPLSVYDPALGRDVRLQEPDEAHRLDVMRRVIECIEAPIKAFGVRRDWVSPHDPGFELYLAAMCQALIALTRNHYHPKVNLPRDDGLSEEN